MKLNKYDTVVEATNALRKRGFKDEFKLKDENTLQCIRTGKTYRTDEMKITEYHRFEGTSNPGDMAIVVAIECKDGTGGTLISSYGPYADRKLTQFISNVKIKEQEGAR